MNCDNCRDNINKLMGMCNRCGKPVRPADCSKGKGCGTDKHDCCGCPQPLTGIASLYDDEPWKVRFNYGGLSHTFDFKPAIEAGQTDTSLTTLPLSRGLEYKAERHTDFIPAQDLGGILHISDLGDVDITNVQENSLFVYHKDADCAIGMDCQSNAWGAWNANDSDNRVTSATTVMGFDEDGNPRSIQPPANTNQYYDFGWNAQGKAGYNQPVAFASFPLDDNNYAYIACIDPKTMQQGFVKVAKGTSVIVN